MRKTIWKYELGTHDNKEIQIPRNADILCVQTQNGQPCIWALVNPDNPTEERHFETFGTGHDVYCDMGVERKYIGSYQLMGGPLVFHVFERTN